MIVAAAEAEAEEEAKSCWTQSFQLFQHVSLVFITDPVISWLSSLTHAYDRPAPARAALKWFRFPGFIRQITFASFMMSCTVS